MARKKFWSTWQGKVFLVILGVLTLGGVGIAGYQVWSIHDARQTANAIKKEEHQALKQKMDPKAIKDKPHANGEYSWGSDNSGIPNAKQLKANQNGQGTLTQLGYAGTNRQPGLKNPITASPIFVGASDKVLASGTGTLLPDFKLGHGNNGLARHSFGGSDSMGGYTLGFSPLQEIDVSKQPKFYETDGKKLYTYKLTDRKVINTVKNPDAYQDAVYADQTDKVTLVTCDEPEYGTVNRHPEKRIVVSGTLVDVQNFGNAPQKVQNIFPQVVS